MARLTNGRNKVTGAAIASALVVASSLVAPTAARADIIPDPPRDYEYELETYRRNEQSKRRAQRENVPDMSDGKTAHSTPTDIPIGWVEPIVAVSGLALAGGLTVVAWCKREGHQPR